MEKSSTLNLRINPALKKDAECVLSKLEIPMSVAVDMFLHQVVLTGGIPFSVALPKASVKVDASQMSEEDIHEKIMQGYDSYTEGRTQDAASAFEEFRKNQF